MSTAFDHAELYDFGPQRSYDDACGEVAFLLGGIGTGNVSVGSRGQLRDWEIFGTAGKGNFIPNTFFAIWTRRPDAEPQAKVLESRLHPPFSKARGFVDHEVAGLPRFDRAVCRGEYPYFTVDLTDDDMPVDVSMEAFTPFIPLNADDSGLPTALLRYRVTNTTDEPVEVSVAGSLGNVTSLTDYHKHTWNNYDSASEGVNDYRDDGAVRGLLLRPKDLSPDSLYYGTMALTTTATDVSHKRSWLRGGWWDGLQDMWDDFRADGRLEPESQYVQGDVEVLTDDQTGSLAVSETIAPGATHTFEFQLTWNFPNRVRSWSRRMYDTDVRGRPEQGAADLPAGEYPVVRKRCARFADAWAVARYTADNLDRLEGHSRAFHRAMFGSTLPRYVIDAVSATITVIRSNTCVWLEDGSFLAWEGCFDDEGCCEGTCTHVWNYAQSLAFLFPELERTMRRAEYLVETDDGKMNFRSYRQWGMSGHDHAPAADGQLGTLVRLYREWRLSGDDAFLAEVWPTAKATLDFAFDHWDGDGDRVLDRNQFNTYDIAFQGPSSMINSIFYAALRAGEEMARHLGDDASADGYRRVFDRGSARMDAMLWGGSYYVQQLDSVDAFRYQYGRGCLADQVFGQTLAHVAGLGYVLPREHVAAAVKSIFDHNFLRGAARHHNPQRTYLLNDEAGLLLCTWPDGGRPLLPFPYSDEVWTGIEYQVATNLIYEGFVDEALTLVKATRDRHDGIRRNPWNEVECGHHYARSLASYGVLVALSGFEYDLPRGRISFGPRISADDFRCFFAAGTAWGIYHRRTAPDGAVDEGVEVLYGSLDGVELRPGTAAPASTAPTGA